jgi:hypothetical protein
MAEAFRAVFGQGKLVVALFIRAADFFAVWLANQKFSHFTSDGGAQLVRSVRRTVRLTFGLLFASGLMAAPLVPAAAKPILVHYMPWFVAKPYSASWGWHWTMNFYNPDSTNSAGQRQIASWYYPLIGPYDSADPAVLEYHVLLMKLAGIDGVVADWYGQDNFLDYGTINQRSLALLNQTRRAGLKFALCYEDRTIQEKINRGYITASGAIVNAQQTMLYAQANYFASANYLQLTNRPVLLNFGPQFFKTNAHWETIYSVLAAGDRPAFFTEDIRLPVGFGAFNWPPMYLSQANGGVVSPAALENYLVNFQQTASSWPAFISSAFPRFHDIYQQAGLGFTHGKLEDNNGLTFRSTLTRALTNNSAFVQVVTWNDFGEGTIVEPTVQFGYRDLGVIQDFRRQHFDPGFSYSTNDLALALRFYNLRRQHVGNAIVSAELDRAFTNVVSGNLPVAGRQLAGLESSVPIIHSLSLTNDILRFGVGGYLSAGGAEIQTTSNLGTAWQTAGSVTVTTNPVVFTTAVSTQAGPAFFRIRTSRP